MQEIDYKNFFDDFLNFKDIQNKQKARGLNDFNLLTTVLKYHDEVRLHSRMIGALLDPSGKHYQGILFLEIFLKQIKLDNWFDDLQNVKVGIEYKDIDLYLSDGVKHLIIENKIWADDQPCQIIKYINIIVEKNKEELKNPAEGSKLDEDRLKVLYLTPRAKTVSSEHAIFEETYITFSGNDDKLKKCSQKENTTVLVPNGLKNYKAWYKKITYKEDIFQWLKNSLKEIRNITNLSESINQYITVVNKVNKKYQGNVMTLENYMQENKNMYKHLEEINKDLIEFKKNIEENFWNELEESLKNKFNTNYDVKLTMKSNYKNKPEIKVSFISDNNKFIFIRRNHNTFYGLSFANNEIGTYLKNDDKLWAYTKPRINFQEHDNKYWQIANPENREEAIRSIVIQIEELAEKLEELNLI